MSAEASDGGGAHTNDNENIMGYGDARAHTARRLKLKSTSRNASKSADESDAGRHRKRRRRDGHADSEEHSTSDPSHRHHRRRRRHHRRDKGQEGKRGPEHKADEEDGEYMDPDRAFRESLFDAMADDEGAEFWEGVYGQPVHTYPNAKEGPDGELEKMTDEEYVAYVRGRMWEKSHEYVVEERERRAEEARRKREGAKRTAQMEAEAEVLDRQMRESLARGRERRGRKQWEEAWSRYVKGWEELIGGEERGGEVAWPVRTGKMQDVDKEQVEEFFGHGVEVSGIALGAMLKSERVRWHPDKVQQRVGAGSLGEGEMQRVTMIFQTIDAMYERERQQAR